MSKYKTGDKIKCIKVFNKTEYEDVTLGKIYIINTTINVNNDNKYEIIDDKGKILVFWETSELETDGFEPYIETDIDFLDMLKGY